MKSIFSQNLFKKIFSVYPSLHRLGLLLIGRFYSGYFTEFHIEAMSFAAKSNPGKWLIAIFGSCYTYILPMNSIVNQSDINQLLKRDEIFTKINAMYGPPPDWQRPEGFISLARIILEQQVSLQSANAHFIKLDSYLKEFTPSEILKLSDAEMRNCQISKQKSTYLRELSSAILSGSIKLENFRLLPEDEIRQQLKSIKGIGDWTANIYLMFCLQTKDIFPEGDIAIINTVKELTSAVTRDEIKALAARWKPYRSLAAYFLWHYYLRKRNR